MKYKDVYELVKGEDILQLSRIDDDGKEWELIIHNDSVNDTTSITLDRKNMKDFIEALEAERYGTTKDVDV